MDWQFVGIGIAIVALIIFLWYAGLAIAMIAYQNKPDDDGKKIVRKLVDKWMSPAVKF